MVNLKVLNPSGTFCPPTSLWLPLPEQVVHQQYQRPEHDVHICQDGPADTSDLLALREVINQANRGRHDQTSQGNKKMPEGDHRIASLIFSCEFGYAQF